MTTTDRFALLRSPLLLLAVAVLLLNDFVLKAAFHNWFTGKLSDFSGLAAFAIFWCAAWPRHVWTVGSCIAALFVFWKSPYSTGAIEVANAILPFAIGRTVDYTDLIALPVVWLVCRNVHRLPLIDLGKIGVWLAAGVCLFAFGASMLYAGDPGPWHKAYLRADATTEADRAIAVSRLEQQIDDVATKYGWRSSCRPPSCPGLVAGRTYQGSRRSVTVVYDDQRKGLRFTIAGPDPQELEQVKEEIGRAVKERLPSWTFGDWTDPPKTNRSLRLRLPTRSAEVDRAVAIVTQGFRAEGLSQPIPSRPSDAIPRATDVWGDKIYSAGPPVDGPSRTLAIVAGWKVEDDRQQWRLVVGVTAGAPEYVERQTRIIEALKQALGREFGADAVY